MRCELVIFDWAGTLVDFGCRAPLVAFLEAFERCGVPIDEATARRPMGTHKRDHVREILAVPDVAARASAAFARPVDEALGDTIYAEFAARLRDVLPRHAEPIDGAVETLAWLRARGVAIGSTTGYTRAMMDVLEPVARENGLDPDVVVCADELPGGRPAPWGCFRVAERLGRFPLTHAVKVGDTPADVAEGRNASMRTVGITESGNEVGLARDRLEQLLPEAREALVASAAARLAAAGADATLRTVAALPAWLEEHA